MVPLSGTRLSGILEVLDVNVYIALIGIRGPCTQGRPISVTSEDINFSGTVSQNYHHNTPPKISSATTLSVVFIALEQVVVPLRGPPKTTPRQPPTPP